MLMLYAHWTKDAKVDFISLFADKHSEGHSYINLPDGSSVGRIGALTHQCRKILEADPNVTVLPALHRKLQEKHLKAFEHINASLEDTTYDICERLAEHHKQDWFHPENL